MKNETRQDIKNRRIQKYIRRSKLYEEIIEWYDSEIKSYDKRTNATDELYLPGTGTIVEYISPECILEGLNILQTANEVNS